MNTIKSLSFRITIKGGLEEGETFTRLKKKAHNSPRLKVTHFQCFHNSHHENLTRKSNYWNTCYSPICFFNFSWKCWWRVIKTLRWFAWKVYAWKNWEKTFISFFRWQLLLTFVEFLFRNSISIRQLLWVIKFTLLCVIVGWIVNNRFLEYVTVNCENNLDSFPWKIIFLCREFLLF